MDFSFFLGFGGRKRDFRGAVATVFTCLCEMLTIVAAELITSGTGYDVIRCIRIQKLKEDDLLLNETPCIWLTNGQLPRPTHNCCFI